MLTRRRFASTLATPFLASGVFAQQQIQGGKTVRLVVPFSAGQGSDLLARAVAQQLTVRWNQPVTVENKPGANGRPRFVYDLPKDFPFNEACIEKSISNDLAHNGAMNCGSNGLGTNSQ